MINTPEKKKNSTKKTEEESTDEESDDWKNQLIECIKECDADGFPRGEITILVRRGIDGTKCAEWLQENDIASTTSDSFLLKRSIHVRALMGFLEYSEYPDHHFAGFDCAQALSEIHPSLSLQTFITEHIKGDKYKVDVDLNGFLTKQFGDISEVYRGESVFSLAIAVIRKLKLQTDSGVEFLLNHIKQECIQHNLNLSQFIQWWKEKKHTLKIMTAAHPEAVNIMTIHKSKGLEFPAVIVPLFKATSNSNQIWIDLEDEVYGLPVGLVGASKISADSKKEPSRIKHPKIEPEAYNMLLDDTNTLYVATTRASQRLYFIYASGGSFFNASVHQTLGALYPDFIHNGACTLGRRKPFIRDHKDDDAHMARPASLIGDASLLPRLRVIPAKQRDTPFMAYGKMLHDALSYLDTADSVEAAVQRAVKSLPAQEETTLQQLRKDIDAIRQHPKLAPWYSGEGTVVNERELCSSSGDIVRPDRVVELEDCVVVIDYKTGLKSDRHAQQVDGYKHQLKTLYNKPAKGYIVYTRPLEIIEV